MRDRPTNVVPTEHVVGIDPGLDGAGFAWVKRTPAGTITVERVFSIRTKAKDPMAYRLSSLLQHTGIELQGIRDEISGLKGVHRMTVVLEVPRHVGRSHKAKVAGGENVFAADMSKFWQAMGVIRAMAHDAEWWLVEREPGGRKKEDRVALLSRWTGEGKNADERDAIVVGVSHLLEKESVADVARRTAR